MPSHSIKNAALRTSKLDAEKWNFEKSMREREFALEEREREDLIAAGFAISGSKLLLDIKRPDESEVRYFNSSDKAQAEKLAEFMRFRLDTRLLVAKEYQDPTAKPGYIEIWLGRTTLTLVTPGASQPRVSNADSSKSSG